VTYGSSGAGATKQTCLVVSWRYGSLSEFVAVVHVELDVDHFEREREAPSMGLDPRPPLDR
jgi:hypothetical protein